jgi:hypothetical protein
VKLQTTKRKTWLAVKCDRMRPIPAQAWLNWFDLGLMVLFGLAFALVGLARARINLLGSVPPAVAPCMVITLIFLLIARFAVASFGPPRVRLMDWMVLTLQDAVLTLVLLHLPFSWPPRDDVLILWSWMVPTQLLYLFLGAVLIGRLVGRLKRERTWPEWALVILTPPIFFSFALFVVYALALGALFAPLVAMCALVVGAFAALFAGNAPRPRRRIRSPRP